MQIAASVITVVGSFLMMVVISPVLVLVFAVTIPMSILFTRYMTKKVRPLFHQRSVKLGEMNGFVEEVITGQKTTKAYHQEETMSPALMSGTRPRWTPTTTPTTTAA